MCFLGFLRSGEVVVPSDSAFDPSMHLAYGDVRADNTSSPQFLEVRIKASKTGQDELCPLPGGGGSRIYG